MSLLDESGQFSEKRLGETVVGLSSCSHWVVVADLVVQLALIKLEEKKTVL